MLECLRTCPQDPEKLFEVFFLERRICILEEIDKVIHGLQGGHQLRSTKTLISPHYAQHALLVHAAGTLQIRMVLKELNHSRVIHLLNFLNGGVSLSKPDHQPQKYQQTMQNEENCWKQTSTHTNTKKRKQHKGTGIIANNNTTREAARACGDYFTNPHSKLTTQFVRGKRGAANLSNMNQMA